MNNNNQCGCHCQGCGPNISDDKVLTITWQRLVSEGSTCPRCGSTEDELTKAVAQLRNMLSPLGLKVELIKKELNLEEFKKDPAISNAILFNGVTLEKLVNAQTGHSKCCDVCGDEECRTVEAEGETYETIPADMIVKAGLIAGAKILE